VDESFECIVHLSFWGAEFFMMPGGRGEFGSEQVFSIHQMNAQAGAEGSF
jgi:hypothetical protein